MSQKHIVRIQAIVEDGGRIAIDLPTLPAGTAVEILLLLPEQPQPAGPIFKAMPAPPAKGHLRQSAADVELYLEAKRAAWDH